MPSIFTKRVLAACTACVLSNSAFAQSSQSAGVFTNHAGHVVSGTLSSISNGVATIGKRRYPLSIFPDREQARMYGLLNMARALPPELMSLFKSLRERQLRNEALLKSGVKDREKAQSRRRYLHRMWLRAVDEYDLDAPARRYALSLWSAL